MSDTVRIEASIPREEWEAYQCGDTSMDAMAPEWREVGEAMVPRAALEYMVEFVLGCPPEGPYPSDCSAETDGSGEICTRCWVTAALKAVEEAES